MITDTDAAPTAMHAPPAPLTPRERIDEHARRMEEWAAEFGEDDYETVQMDIVDEGPPRPTM